MTYFSPRSALFSLGLLASALIGTQACSAGDPNAPDASDGDAPDAPDAPDGDADFDSDLGDTDTGSGGTGGGNDDNPATCEQAAASKSYIGCDFWPTVTFNPVDKNFHFAAVVANAGTTASEVTVTRAGAEVAKVTVQPGGLEKIMLPWIDELKGPTFVEQNTSGARVNASSRLDGGAYHLTATTPVTAWQFNPLEFNAGKVAGCIFRSDYSSPSPQADCLSVSNDASLLMPSTAMTGNYRVAGMPTRRAEGGTYDDPPNFVAITATQDGTNVKVLLGPNADVQAGGVIPATAAGGEINLAMNAGDVVELLGKFVGFNVKGDPHGDLTGSLVAADKPVQVISGVSITYAPSPAVGGEGYADHLEETLLPAEALGNEYIVVPPTTPKGDAIGHYVRIVGNFDGTTLSYEGAAPPGAPTTLNAGESSPLMDTSAPFIVRGNNSFAVLSVMKGGQLQDAARGGQPAGDRGDPSMSLAVAPAQFRKKYIFLAPDDYTVKYADIIVPDGATVKVDGADVAVGTPVAAGWSIVRHQLGAGQAGAHVLEASAGVGLQIQGYGSATSFYVPGGLNLKLISPPPPAVN